MDIDSLHDTRTLSCCEPSDNKLPHINYSPLVRPHGGTLQERLAIKYAKNLIMMARQHKNKGLYPVPWQVLHSISRHSKRIEKPSLARHKVLRFEVVELVSDVVHVGQQEKEQWLNEQPLGPRSDPKDLPLEPAEDQREILARNEYWLNRD